MRFGAANPIRGPITFECLRKLLPFLSHSQSLMFWKEMVLSEKVLLQQNFILLRKTGGIFLKFWMYCWRIGIPMDMLDGWQLCVCVWNKQWGQCSWTYFRRKQFLIISSANYLSVVSITQNRLRETWWSSNYKYFKYSLLLHT